MPCLKNDDPKLRWEMKKRLQKQRGDSSVKRPSSVDEDISKPLFVGGLAWQPWQCSLHSNLNTIMMTILWAQIIIYLLIITEHIITSKILNYSFQFIDIDNIKNLFEGLKYSSKHQHGVTREDYLKKKNIKRK